MKRATVLTYIGVLVAAAGSLDGCVGDAPVVVPLDAGTEAGGDASVADASVEADAACVVSAQTPICPCQGKCAAQCSGQCMATGVPVVCVGTCAGTCVASGTGSGIQANGTCQGSCDGTCTYSAGTSQSCAGKCSGACDGTCS